MRWSLWCASAIVFLLGGGCKARIAEGEKCERGEQDQLVGCIDPTTAAQCVNNRLRSFACRGELGCKASGERSASCDGRLGRIGDPCIARGSLSFAICSEDKKTELTCNDARLELAWECRGAKGCDPTQLPDYPVACDRTLARAGDPCRTDTLRSDAKGACTEDGKLLLTCDAEAGSFRVKQSCPGGCKVQDFVPDCE